MRTLLASILLALTTGCGGVTTSPPGSDAGPDAAAAHFCASQGSTPFFCDDFDAAAGLGAWTSSGAQNGTLAVQAGDSTSAPNAMRAEIQPGTASAYATIALPQSGLTHARLSFALRLDPACFTGTNVNNGLVGLGTAVFGSGPSAYAISLFASGGTSLVYEGGGPTGPDAGPGGQYVPAAAIPSGAWARVEMEIDLRSGKQVTTRIDGGDPTQSPLLYPPDTLDTPLVSVGLDAAVSHPTACVALFDDVLFDGGS